MHVGRPLSSTVFVKLVFLLRQETDLQSDPSFYNFVPYNFGPFSFTLYWDLGSLRKNGYVTADDRRIALCERTLELAERHVDALPTPVRCAVADVFTRYGWMSQQALIREIYGKYPWFALNSKLAARGSVSVQRPKKARPAVYTAGYEGRSVDAFFNDLLARGIDVVIDVRANPVSRKYGFSGLRLAEFCNKLGLQYRHMPTLGIPGTARAGLRSFASYQILLKRYEDTILPTRAAEVQKVGHLMRQQPSVLVCVEKDVRCCHRSRLAEAVAREINLEVIHL